MCRRHPQPLLPQSLQPLLPQSTPRKAAPSRVWHLDSLAGMLDTGSGIPLSSLNHSICSPGTVLSYSARPQQCLLSRWNEPGLALRYYCDHLHDRIRRRGDRSLLECLIRLALFSQSPKRSPLLQAGKVHRHKRMKDRLESLSDKDRLETGWASLQIRSSKQCLWSREFWFRSRLGHRFPCRASWVSRLDLKR